MPAHEESELNVPNSPSTLRKMSNVENGDSLAIPGDEVNGPQEIPATRSSISEAAKYMHNLSVSPSMRDRRSSRNSFGTALPIPRKPYPGAPRRPGPGPPGREGPEGQEHGFRL
ncbi:uncharacterized protein FTOL_05045 [Fusarium torulosum]|uniref:Uncharacterized protein n=1 Tax=Fusarium torulosum TaxID=33205 RepID=A0AAE8SHG8_9HYPO|nr:uncharacterized protein FTOL_05045 [Fusarium torulosum]